MGAIQVSSGASRLWLFRRHLDARLMAGFAAAFLPAAFVGGFVWAYVVTTAAAQPWLKMVIGLYLGLYLAHAHSAGGQAGRLGWLDSGDLGGF